MRAVLRTSRTDLSVRLFLGFGLTEALPHHSTFSHAQCRRFAESSVFEQLFTSVLRQCTDAGLVGGRRLLVDATHVKADAALKSLRAELAVIDGGGETADAPMTVRHGSTWGCTHAPGGRSGSGHRKPVITPQPSERRNL